MSELKVNKITPKTGTSIQLGESGDTITIPCGATLTNNGTATGFGLSFCTTVKTSPFTATANKGFLINTGSAVTVTLPASPSTGDEVIIVDQTGQASSNNITLGRNGSKIKGNCEDATMGTDRGGLRLVYSGSSQGWITATAGNDATATQAEFVAATGGTVLTVGNFKTHIFTGDSNFIVSNTGNPSGSTTVDYFVVAGGGGTGRCSSAGGGAGGFRISNSVGCLSAPVMSPLVSGTGITVSAQTYPITVGGGGTGGPAGAAGGYTNGSNSVFSTITSAGGGRGGSSGNGPGDLAGQPGGSGGGGDYNTSTTAGGTGNTPPVSPPQGNNGGTGSTGPSLYGPGGGGGAGAVGNSFPQSPGGTSSGGIGSFLSDSYFGPTAPSYGTPGPVSSVRYFAGGGAGMKSPSNNTPVGGSGGGGAGNPGTTNTGGGGGAASPNVGAGGAGGSGVVAIRYKFQ